MILSDHWITEARAIIQHARHQMRLKMGSKRITIKCPSSTPYEEGKQLPASISYLQATDLICEGGTSVLAVIHEHDDRPSKQPGHPDEVNQILEVVQEAFKYLPPGLPPERGTPFTINTYAVHLLQGEATAVHLKRKIKLKLKLKTTWQKTGYVQIDHHMQLQPYLYRRKMAVYAYV